MKGCDMATKKTTKKTKKKTTKKTLKEKQATAKAEVVNGLPESMVNFITNKVEELGNKDSVYKFYNLKDTVSEFARDLADAKYGEN